MKIYIKYHKDENGKTLGLAVASDTQPEDSDFLEDYVSDKQVEEWNKYLNVVLPAGKYTDAQIRYVLHLYCTEPGTLQDLAEKSGVAKGTIHGVISGKTHKPLSRIYPLEEGKELRKIPVKVFIDGQLRAAGAPYKVYEAKHGLPEGSIRLIRDNELAAITSSNGSIYSARRNVLKGTLTTAEGLEMKCTQWECTKFLEAMDEEIDNVLLGGSDAYTWKPD
jgi:hypothetical protein